MQQRTITKGCVVTTLINADINDVINCPKIGKAVKIHDCVLTDCNYEKGHLICTGKSYVHCSFCEGVHPSLKEQMHGAEKDPVQVPPFDHKACILCDHVIVQKILGNKCGQSGSLCCNLKECPIEARKKRETIPVKQLTIESYGDGAISISHDPFETHFNKQEVTELRAYLNKDVIAELERLIECCRTEDWDHSRVYIDAYSETVKLLKGDVP